MIVPVGPTYGFGKDCAPGSVFLGEEGLLGKCLKGPPGPEPFTAPRDRVFSKELKFLKDFLSSGFLGEFRKFDCFLGDSLKPFDSEDPGVVSEFCPDSLELSF
uniref:Uncharacterized protein n=1 Tax=Cacopsylla melanoneura TaxID=428564 RepID=A0A8D9B537_9HEMI